MLSYVDIILKLCSLGLVIATGGLWAGAGVETRPKYKDEQTLVGGAIWSQTIIPIGLMISKIVDENLDSYVHGYFLVSGITILCSTGIFLILEELKTMRRNRRIEAHLRRRELPIPQVELYDKIYITIGVLSLMAASFKMCELLVLIMK